mmetsp:Transcript_39353/g.44303  ORF Transcript_39353/g.44303 Transcript_39353/m.44303 type:complete len:169 (-) Transcript_39353:91-597(-)
MNVYYFSILLTTLLATGTAAMERRLKKKGKKSVKGSAEANAHQEIAVVDSDTTGKLKYEFDKGFTKMDYEVFIRDGIRITGIHLHCGSAGTDGAVAAVMFSDPPGTDIEDGSIVKGSIQSGGLVGIECEGLQVTTIASLYQAMRNGSIYMNIHDIENPGGVARGQIFV